MFGLFGEIGYLIAIPAVLFGFGGAYLDRTLGTSPLFILTGMALAIAISILAVWRRIKPLLDS
jgi:F0F1-type ATP synthase assembly protein I